MIKPTPPFQVATIWEWLEGYYSLLVACQEEGKKERGQFQVILLGQRAFEGEQ